ncbi:hypothetical protein [Methanopyrus kandleri]|uniref:Uncharacterized protein n=2 Tax=Methanopyrus kandleri TaxID=2320 RepID=Q8TX40_METKA|nr:hypothetical protein [Methanopyrus kandleri]AAM02050.1 Uncharacterized protein MK0837 [Methanopyrus kandleri AV19]HII69935.1 hypothetical protein [Methanopyrus kandleri]
MIDRLAKKYLTPEKVAELGFQITEELALRALNLIRNLRTEAKLEGDSYSFRVWDEKDRYEISASGEFRGSGFTLEFEKRVLDTRVRGHIEVEGEQVTELMRRLLEILKEGKES